MVDFSRLFYPLATDLTVIFLGQIDLLKMTTVILNHRRCRGGFYVEKRLMLEIRYVSGGFVLF